MVTTVVISLYSIIDQGVTLTHMKEGCSDTENDLEVLIEIINQTDLSKKEISKILEKHNLSEHTSLDSDTINLERITLLFELEKLTKIEKQW